MISFHHPIVSEDLAQICSTRTDWTRFAGKTVMITGATGMLATYLTYFFLYLKKEQKIDLRLIILCRTERKAKALFGEQFDNGDMELLLQDICDPLTLTDKVDYIFHLAGNASPKYINTDPVGIITANIIGTRNVLELARKSGSKVFFASTREVYGANEGKLLLDEDSFGYINPMDNRSCYPESKRAAETLLRSYFNQYGVEVYVARIAHTYGPGMQIENDGRIMADLIGNAVRGEDIVLKSKGEALRAFCYLSDAISGILTIMMSGEPGEAYNLSNETEEISILQLAELMVKLSEGKSQLKFDIPPTNTGYCNYQRVALDSRKINVIGFRPQVPLKEGIRRTIQSFIASE